MIEVYFDGACEPRNPGGHLGFGFLVKKDGNVLHSQSGYKAPSRENTNNLSEYTALLSALAWLYKNNCADEHIQVFGDSQLVVKQMNREWGMKKGAYIPIAKRCISAENHFKSISYTWIPRGQNSEADALSKAEFDKRGIKSVLGI